MLSCAAMVGIGRSDVALLIFIVAALCLLGGLFPRSRFLFPDGNDLPGSEYLIASAVLAGVAALTYFWPWLFAQR
jgi:hypothetical protein